MTVPQRIQRKRTRGWRMPENAVYVGRPSRWGNPFRVYNERTLIGPAWWDARATWKHLPADQCLNAYITSSSPIGQDEVVRIWVDLLRCRARDEPDLLSTWLKPLRGRDLACWCPLDQPCHADALLALVNGGYL